MTFNKPSVQRFYGLLSEVMIENKLCPCRIYNIDETSLTTVLVTGKVLSKLGKKQVGATTSAERGEPVTVCCGVNAQGQLIPLCYIFPRVNLKNIFINGAKGVAIKSGYMNSELFVKEYQPILKQKC
ncbi:unnamed protein product [Lepeophtheirus salmonis]|uniref:(salmon louse) hypothetical protein n=1 Tax=Lepeophtheirus salmonis TaxID=72036 RepID=A0A7R8D2B8_LEPSM|nr:unnamed protein product [Lepeophtheirus salmonis]CAF3003280.1 unnamed protein product [Lepeophtheirus salmonis]